PPTFTLFPYTTLFRSRPDVVLLDLVMPRSNGIGATRQILAQNPAIKILILSSSNNASDISRVIEAGAAGYVVKQTAGQDLFKARSEEHTSELQSRSDL